MPPEKEAELYRPAISAPPAGSWQGGLVNPVIAAGETARREGRTEPAAELQFALDNGAATTAPKAGTRQ